MSDLSFKEYVWADIIDGKTPNGFGFTFNVGWPQYKFIENDQGINVKFYKWETELPLVEKYVGHTFLDTRYNGRVYGPWETYYIDDDLSHKVLTKYEEDFKRFDY